MARSKKGKRTFQPNTSRRAKRHGFLVRMATKDGRQVLSAAAPRAESVLPSLTRNERLRAC